MSHFPPANGPMGMKTTAHPLHVLVIGAGYGGLLAANRLAARGARVTLVNDRPEFVDRIRLHEVIAGTRPPERVAVPLEPRMGAGVAFLVARATTVSESDAAARVDLTDGRTLTADHVLLATGSGAGSGSWVWALAHRERIATLGAGARVVVRGAGLTGLEVAAELADARPDLQVALVDPAGVGRAFSDPGRRHLLSALARLGVALDAPDAPDHSIDCTGFTLPGLAAASGLSVDARGGVLVDATGRVEGRERLWATGDAARVADQPHLGWGCRAAEPMAAQTADQVLRAGRGEEPRAVSVGYALRCVSLGRRDGVIEFVERDDTPTGRVLTGRLAVGVKEGICWVANRATDRWSRHYVSVPGPRTAAPEGALR